MLDLNGATPPLSKEILESIHAQRFAALQREYRTRVEACESGSETEALAGELLARHGRALGEVA